MLCCCIPLIALSQVKTKYFKEGIPSALKSARAAGIAPHVIPAPASFDQLKTAAPKTNGEYSGKFATPANVAIDVLQSAVVVEERNTRTYLLTLKGEKALNLSLQFGKFRLSGNAVLSIHNQFEITDSITAKENNPQQVWATRVYQSNQLTISLKVPKGEIKDNILLIDKVNFGFLPFGGDYFGNAGSSASCNVNVACPTGNNWQNEKNSVALIVANGDEACTGALIMNTGNTNTPYFLTANHCLDAGNVPNWVFQFQTWSTVCNGNSGWVEDVQFNGCTLRANHAETDFALLQLTQTPGVNSGLNYAGWTRCTTPAASATTIHHPRGDLMKISQDNNPLVSVAYQGGPSDHWRATFDVGIVQHGSSGAPLFDPAHRIVGQLHGNQVNGCAQTDNTCFCNQSPVGEYGRFDISWTGGGTNATRLSNWLDPGNTNALSTNTSAVHRLNGLAGQFDLYGDPHLNSPTQTYSLYYNGLLYNGAISWSSSNTSVGTVSGSGHTVTVTRVGGCGQTMLTATEAACGNNTVVLSNPIGVQAPELNGFDFTKNGNPCYPSFGVTFNGNGGCALRTDANIQEVEYWISSPYSYSISYNSGSLSCYSTSIVNKAGFTGSFPTQSQPYVVTFRFRVRNNCDWSEWSPGYYHFVQSCGFAFTVTPNPVSSRVEVALDETTMKKTSDHSIREVQISDKTGRILRQTRYGPGTQRLTLDMSGLKPDVYFLRVFDGKEWRSESIIKR